MRRFTMLDLIRFHKFYSENPDFAPVEAVTKYKEKYPELTPKQQYENVMKFLNSDYFDFENKEGDKPCGCNGDCACDENFAESERLKNTSIIDNFLCVETDKGNPRCKIQCPFCERV